MLRVNNLKKHYGDFSLDVTMEVKEGRITGLVGRNGAGKSTAFKCILDLVNADGGSIELFGKNPKDFSVSDKEKLGVVLADSTFCGYLKIKDIISIMNAMYTDFDKEYFTDLCKRFNLPMNKRIKDFSTGMKAKLKVAAAVSHNAKFLVLDEVTSGLDVVVREEILDILRD